MEAADKMRYEVHLATADDVGELVRMQIALQESTVDIGTHMLRLGRESMLQLHDYYRSQIADEQTRVLVARDGRTAQTVGMGMGRIWVHAGYVPTRSGELIDIWVEPDHRRRGLATRIIARLLQFFHVNRIEFLAVNYVEGNHLGETLWRKLGFSPVLATATAARSTVARAVGAGASRIVPVAYRQAVARPDMVMALADRSA